VRRKTKEGDGKMSNPPMTVWLSQLKMSWQVAEPTKSVVCKEGPYVNLEQFLEEVNRRAEQKMLKTRKLEGSHYAAMQELAKEIEEGNG
jgi:hypothetical protein